MSKICPICSNTDVHLVQGEIKEGVKTDVLRCVLCDLDFLETWDDVVSVKALYEGDNYVFTHNAIQDPELPLKFNEYDARYDWMRPYFSREKSLLEVGCGDGTFLRMVQQHLQIVEGMELSPPQVNRLRREGFTCYDKMLDQMCPPKRYDIVCMFALLEHVPLVRGFLEALKGYIHQDTDVFIEVPNLNDPLVSGYDVPEYRTFYYRPVHLYYFTPKSLGHLLEKAGFSYTLHTVQQASITNHFHWMHNRRGQPNANFMTSVMPPVGLLGKLPIKDVLEQVDDYYRALVQKYAMGDLLCAHVRLKAAA
jgi:hypothetical protein